MWNFRGTEFTYKTDPLTDRGVFMLYPQVRPTRSDVGRLFSRIYEFTPSVGLYKLFATDSIFY